jgi:thioredoxin-related protein
MKQIAIMLYCLLPVFAYAQEQEAVNFSKANNWSELLEEAKSLNKSIFIDAYATWCGPCKQMDRDVFTQKEVIDFLNEHFVSIKIQMDSAKNDNKSLQNWRKDAEIWSNRISGYPCFLFFTSDGKFAGLELGYHPPGDFLKLLRNAIDPVESYYSLIHQFRADKLNYKQLLSLAFRARQCKDSIAINVAMAYKNKYLDSLPLDSMLTPGFSKFAIEFYDVFNAKDKIIKYMNKNPGRVDALAFQTRYAVVLSDYIIKRDYINRLIFPGGIPVTMDPKWKMIEKLITRDFDKRTADRLILDSKISWAQRHNSFEEATKFEFEKIDKYGMDTSGFGRIMFNNMIYSIVLTSVNNVVLLKNATRLMKFLTDIDRGQTSSFLDTYACMLYKIGNKAEALEIETKALNRAKQEKDLKNINLYTNMIERMKNDEEIWKNLD